MKVYTALPDFALPSATTSASLDSEKNAKAKSDQVTYPYKAQLRSALDAKWISLFITATCFSNILELYYNPQDFFYPCNFASDVSVNDTLKLKARLNETQNFIDSYQSHFSITPDITAAETQKYNATLKNVTEEFAMLKKQYDYQKTQWIKCFTENVESFGFKVQTAQSIFSFIGLALSLYGIYKFSQYTAKLKKMNLTEEQKEAYEKAWKGINGLKTCLICHWLYSVSLFLYLLVSFLPVYPFAKTDAENYL
jgi:hypothetical protein